MSRDIPIPGTTQHRLIRAGIERFSEVGYKQAEVDHIAANAGVTVGALYHHYKSKENFYGLLRDDVTLRIVDRIDAVAEAVPKEQALKSAFLAAFDGMIRLKAGRLLSEPDPRGGENAIAHRLGRVAVEAGRGDGEILGLVLAEALRAALSCVVEHGKDPEATRRALSGLL